MGLSQPHVPVADTRQWEYIAYCLSQLTFSEKGLKKLIESFKVYEHVLSEDSVMNHFRSIVAKVVEYSLHLVHTCYWEKALYSEESFSFDVLLQ